jgi:hypothetical protein
VSEEIVSQIETLRRRGRCWLGVFRPIGLGGVAVDEVDVFGQAQGRLKKVLVQAVDLVAIVLLGLLPGSGRANLEIPRAPAGRDFPGVDLVLQPAVDGVSRPMGGAKGAQEPD